MKKKLNNKRLGYAIGRTNWYIKTLLNKQLKESDLNITTEQWTVLKIVSEHPGASQTEIADKCLKDKTNITRILDLLERSSCIERRRDEEDRRMYRIHLTSQGSKALSSVQPVTDETEVIITNKMSRKEIDELIEILNSVVDRVKIHL